MTGPVTFGELADRARWHLDQAAREPWAGHGRDLPDVARAMRGLTLMMSKVLRGFGETEGSGPGDGPGASVAWAVARRKACYAAVLATRALDPPPVVGRGAASASQRGRHLGAAARALAAAQDLLATHVAVGDVSRSGAAGRSPWAPALASAEVRRAVVAEMADLAGRAARLGSGMVAATPTGWEELQGTRRGLALASRHLRILAAIAGEAHRQEPVLADDSVLLRGFRPARLPRRVPDGREQVAELCDGVVAAAERLRQSAWMAFDRPARSPSCSGDSLRYAAAAGVAVNEHCGVLLRILGGRAWPGSDSGAVVRAGEAAVQSRDAWLRVARTLDQVTPDVRGHLGQEVIDADDLAHWSERLAQGLVAASGAVGRFDRTTVADAEVRAAPGAAVGPAGAEVARAVHYAADAMSLLAEVHGLQARKIAQGRRFFVPSWSLPDYYDKTRPYAPAPPDRVDAVISAYDQAYQAALVAQQVAGELAEFVGSPSRALTLARKAAVPSGAVRETRQAGRPLTGAGPYPWARPPGHVEQALRELGVTDPHRIGQARDFDYAGEQLVSNAAAECAGQVEVLAAASRGGRLSGRPGSAGPGQGPDDQAAVANAGACARHAGVIGAHRSKVLARREEHVRVMARDDGGPEEGRATLQRNCDDALLQVSGLNGRPLMRGQVPAAEREAGQ